MKMNKRRAIFSTFTGIILSLFATSFSKACSTTGLLPTASWAPNAIVHVISGGVPSAITVAIANWNFGLAAIVCNGPTLIAGTAGGGPAITMSYQQIPPPICPPGQICFTRGQTNFPTATYLSGHLETITIEINSSITSAAAITEVGAHEIGHTFGLADCNGCALYSTVMVSHPALPAGIP